MKRKYILLLSITLILQGCFNISTSPLRPVQHYKFELDDELDIFSEGPVKFMKKDFLPASFRIEYKETTFYIDPLKIENSKPADYILITHKHPDHFSKEDIEKIAHQNTLIICPSGVAKKIKSHKVKTVKPGEEFEIGSIKIRAVHAYNTKPTFLWIKGHPQKANNLGYILTINGKRIYHGGDTSLIPEMKEFSGLTLALVPVGGDKLTMDIKEAAQMVNSLNPKYTIPMHYEAGKGYGKKFKELVKRQTKVILFESQPLKPVKK